MDIKSGLVLYVPKGAAEDQAILCDPAPEAEEVQNGERLSRAKAADLLGIRRAELDELAEAGLIVVRQDAETGKSYIRASDFRKFVKNLEPVQFVEAGAEEETEDEEEDWDEEEEDAEPAAVAKPAVKAAAKPASPMAEVAGEQIEDLAETGAYVILAPVGVLSRLLGRLGRLGGEMVGGVAEEAEEAEEQAEPAKQVKTNPAPSSTGKPKSGRRSSR